VQYSPTCLASIRRLTAQRSVPWSHQPYGSAPTFADEFQRIALRMDFHRPRAC
jgi:hypothetical protein